MIGGGLAQFADGQFDFLIISHVLEHVANPIQVVREIFRIVRVGAIVLIAVPDRDFTYDRNRELTPFGHVWRDYEEKVCENSDEHYLDFLRNVGPHVFDEPAEKLPGHIQWVRGRREHAHVWDSRSFRAFLDELMRRLGICAIIRVESSGSENGLEHFSAWEKCAPPDETGG